jgi:hypothetical protein
MRIVGWSIWWRISAGQRSSESHRAKKRVELAGLRADPALAVEQFGMSERWACRLVKLDRSSYRYEPRADYNAQLREERLHVLLSKRGHPASAQRVYRLYREERLMVRQRRK